jgi:hypothetical protein
MSHPCTVFSPLPHLRDDPSRPLPRSGFVAADLPELFDAYQPALAATRAVAARHPGADASDDQAIAFY